MSTNLVTATLLDDGYHVTFDPRHTTGLLALSALDTKSAASFGNPFKGRELSQEAEDADLDPILGLERDFLNKEPVDAFNTEDVARRTVGLMFCVELAMHEVCTLSAEQLVQLASWFARMQMAISLNPQLVMEVVESDPEEGADYLRAVAATAAEDLLSIRLKNGS